MNANASSWNPNAGAASFTPSWSGGAPAPAPAEEDVADAWDDGDDDAAEESKSAQGARLEQLGAPELRIDASDGNAYPLQSFYEAYGMDEGQYRWDRSEPLQQPPRTGTPAEPKPKLTMASLTPREPTGAAAAAKPTPPPAAAPAPAPKAKPKAKAPAPAPAPEPEPAPEVEPEPADPEEYEWEDPESLREPGDTRKHVNLVFIGHVDAGKSTLCGQIMWQSGNLDDRTLDKFEQDAKAANRESWKFAYAMDTNEEERAKGKTVEVGRAFFTTEHKRFTVLDAPGHKNFVPHMIGGASQADIGILLIAARKGEFETGFEKGGQTREHVQLAKTAGVKHLVIVINKMDDVTVEWSEERYTECQKKLFPFLKASGFRPKKDCTWLPISALTGINIGKPLDKSICPWYDGKPLLQTLNDMPPPEQLLQYPVRMPIVDKFADMGTIVLGKLQSGLIKKGAKLIICPIDMKCTVMDIEKHGEPAEFCEPGDNVKIKLTGIEDAEQIESGFMLCPEKFPIPYTTVFDAEVPCFSH